MRNFDHLAWLAAAAIVASSANAIAAEELTCKPFDVYSSGEFREFHRIDYNADGSATTPGDRLIGSRVLLDVGGDQVGQRFFVGTIEKFDADGNDLERITETVNVFSNGAVFTTKQRVAGSDLPSRITGGTGVFVGATGTVKVRRDGVSNVYQFNLTCGGPAAQT